VTKRALIIATVIGTLAIVAYAKNPEAGQDNITNLIQWIWPW
jgi:hypothetical protein